MSEYIGYIVVVIVFAALVAALGWSNTRPDREATVEPAPSAEASAIAALIAEEWDKWSVDRYAAYHADARIGVWIANGLAGVYWWAGGPGDFEGGLGWNTREDRLVIWKALHAANVPSQALRNIEIYRSKAGTAEPLGKVPGGPHGS